MQHPVDTVDPTLLDLRQFPQAPASDGALIQSGSIAHQRSDYNINEDTDISSCYSPSDDFQPSDDLPDNRLEVQQQFFLNSAGERDQQLQSWDDRVSTGGPAMRGEEPLNSLQRFRHVGPWNHLQSFDSQIQYQNQHYRLSRGLSSGVFSSATVGGWPGASHPDSSSTFIFYGGINDARRGHHAEPSIPTNEGATNVLIRNGEQKIVDASSTDSTIHIPLDPENPEFYSPEAEQDFYNDTRYEALDLQIGSPSLYHHYDTLWSQEIENPPDYPTQSLSNYQKVGSFDKKGQLVTFYDEDPGFYQYNDPLSEYPGVTHPQPTIIGIERTPKDFEPDVVSSYSPQAGYFSDYWPKIPKAKQESKARPASRSLALRPASRNLKSNKKSSITNAETPLSVIHEDGKGGVASRSPTTKKGRRAGPLSKSKAAQAAKMRKEKSVCIRCKLMKQSCSGENPCVGCRENVGAKIWKSPCVKAEFLDLIESGTCNYISQRSINHLTLDKSRRVTMHLPAMFDLNELLGLLKPRLSRFNIHTRQLSGSLYTLDLAKCYDFLLEIRNVQGSGRFALQDFIDNKLLKASDWLKCITEPFSMTESLDLLAKWNNMPSRAGFEIVSLCEDVSSRPMDVENEEDKAEILIAAQLSRIICRALEVSAFKFLQKELNNLTKGSKSNEGAEKFVRELGQLLVTLRWRICWWELLGDGSAIQDDSRDRYVERVKKITRVLYFYYCNAKKKLPSWTDPQSLKGIQSRYADAEPIFDDFPHTDSIEGFHEWMTHGQDLIHEAGVQQRLSRY